MNDAMRTTLAPGFDKANEFMDKIDELESYVAELQMENKDLNHYFEDAVQSYLDATELYEIYLDEIKLLLDICKKHGINIPEEEHCCGIIDKIRDWIV
ncbi:MAG: hypothetical protein GX115_01755 [Ruminiclostridium sp.]|nr:hypothetical protein [Ruminiclostridium sp.]